MCTQSDTHTHKHCNVHMNQTIPTYTLSLHTNTHIPHKSLKHLVHLFLILTRELMPMCVCEFPGGGALWTCLLFLTESKWESLHSLTGTVSSNIYELSKNSTERHPLNAERQMKPPLFLFHLLQANFFDMDSLEKPLKASFVLEADLDCMFFSS